MNFTRIVALIVKELLAAFRDPKARIALIAPPLVQLLLYAYAATMDVNHVTIGVLNQDWGLASTQFLARLERTPAFAKIQYYQTLDEVRRAIDAQDVIAVVALDQDFSRALTRGERPNVQLLLDGRRSNSAQIVNNYFATIVATFARDYARGAAAAPVSEVVDRTWYNPNRDFRNVMAPSLLATLTMTTVLMIVGMSVARERELGTFEQLLVSPLQPIEIILGKAAPGMVVGLAQGAAIALIVVYGFGIPITGSIPLLFASLALFLVSVIGIALFISSLAANQQQAMMGIMVFMMPAMMLSGFSSPVQNMPDWLQPLAMINPLTHFLVIVRGLFLRDMPADLVAHRLWPMALIGLVTMSAASWLFRRRTQ
jgi:ABC-2 type transport system permease protein